MKARLGPFQARTAPGLTLVEVLLAVTLGALVTSAAAVVSVQAMRSRSAAELVVNRRWDHHRVLAQFRQDVDSRLRDLPATMPAIEFPDDPEKLVEITALTLVSSGGSDVGGRTPARITYLSQVDPHRPNLRRLVRRMEPLIESTQPVLDDVLADSLEMLRMERLEGTSWVGPESARKGNETNLATGVRLQVRSVGSKNKMDVATVSLANDVKTRPNGAGI